MQRCDIFVGELGGSGEYEPAMLLKDKRNVNHAWSNWNLFFPVISTLRSLLVNSGNLEVFHNKLQLYA